MALEEFGRNIPNLTKNRKELERISSIDLRLFRLKGQTGALQRDVTVLIDVGFKPVKGFRGLDSEAGGRSSTVKLTVQNVKLTVQNIDNDHYSSAVFEALIQPTVAFKHTIDSS